MRSLPRGVPARAALLGALALALTFAPGPARAVVVLLGIDGGTWNLIDPAMASGELPNFAALAARGVTARLSAVEPVNSPTVWTSIATGRTPRAHGVTAFLVDRRMIRVPTTWERLAARGRRVGLYDYLVTWPAERLPGGFVVPGWLRRDDRFEPPDLFRRAGLEPYLYSMDGVFTPDQFVANCRRELAELPPRFVRLLEREKPDVAAVTLYSMDATSHRFWSDAFPEEFGADVRPDPRYRTVIDDTLRGIDAALGRIVAALGPDDSLVVVSDHGFHADPRGVRRVWVADVEGWTRRAGLDPDRDAFTQGGFGAIAFAVSPGPFAERDATLDRLYELTSGARTADGEPLYDAYRIDAEPRPPGAERSLWERVRQWAARTYLEWNGIDLDQPAHGFVFARPRDDVLAPLWPQGRVSIGGETAPITERLHVEEFSGSHLPTGIFLAAGPAFAHRAERGDVSVLDVSPLLYVLAGEPVPDDLDGALPTALLSPAWLAAHPPRTVAASMLPPFAEAEPAAAAPAHPRAPAASDEDVEKRLRALGYAE